MKWLHFILLGFVLIASGCTSGIRFYVSPFKLASEVKSKNDIGKKKEVLANQDYRVLIVQRDIGGSILPVQHYRPEHTFGNQIHPRVVTYEDPLTLTALIIVLKLDNKNGIAIKKQDENLWRIHWLQDSDIEELRKEGVVYLPPYEELPVLKN